MNHSHDFILNFYYFMTRRQCFIQFLMCLVRSYFPWSVYFADQLTTMQRLWQGSNSNEKSRNSREGYCESHWNNRHSNDCRQLVIPFDVSENENCKHNTGSCHKHQLSLQPMFNTFIVVIYIIQDVFQIIQSFGQFVGCLSRHTMGLQVIFD